MDVFLTLRDIIAKSEKEMHQSIDLLHKMRPKNLEDSVHNKMIEDVVHEEIEIGKTYIYARSF
jgi:hypothetical protein